MFSSATKYIVLTFYVTSLKMLLCTVITASILGALIARDGLHNSNTKNVICDSSYETPSSPYDVSNRVLMNISDHLLQPSNDITEENISKVLGELESFKKINKWKARFEYTDQATGQTVGIKMLYENDILNIDDLQSEENSFNNNFPLEHTRHRRAIAKAKGYVSGLLKKSDKTKGKDTKKDKTSDKTPNKKEDETDLSKRIVGGTSALQYVPVVSKFRSKTLE